jgi:predicted molibdopterin-dependent oxidoreductase YjgC
MGICFDCLVTVNGVSNVRACLTPVADAMVVETEGPMKESE